MALRRLLLFTWFVTTCVLTTAAVHPAPNSRNLFAELLGKPEADVNAKLDAAWQQLFYGDDQNQRVYYPVGNDMAYIADIGSGDVRSEGMSYGMMIAVQLDKKEEFDRLWNWANKYMRHGSGPRRGYFAWHCQFDGTQLSPSSASDGEEWFAMALFFAAHRWGEGRANPPGKPSLSTHRLSEDASPYPPRSDIHYEDEAQTLLHDMLHKRATAEVTSIFNRQERQVVFVPNPEAGTFTDPSYHLPAFYELWARWSDNKSDRKFWAAAARTSREFFHKAAHPVTGLMPEYAHFDGSPFTETRFGGGKGDFRFDAWRTLANVALDHAWFEVDPWQVEQSNRVLRFLAAQGPDCANQFTLEGKPLSTDTSTGLTAMAAVAGLATEPDLARTFVQRLWDAPIPSGKWRYYDGLLYTLGLLQVSGRFQIHAPAASPTVITKPSPFDSLQKGMTAAQVRKLVGEPAQIKPFQAGGLPSEVWVYQRTIKESIRQVPVGTQDVPVVDPLTGRAGTVKESIMGNETITLSETIELLMIEQRLIELKRKPMIDRSIN